MSLQCFVLMAGLSDPNVDAPIPKTGYRIYGTSIQIEAFPSEASIY